MRISDWSSDVCSSDLTPAVDAAVHRQIVLAVADEAVNAVQPGLRQGEADRAGRTHQYQGHLAEAKSRPPLLRLGRGRPGHIKIGRASCRERVCPTVSLSLVAVTSTNNRLK